MRRSYLGVAGQNVPLHRRVVRFHDAADGERRLRASVEPDSPGGARRPARRRLDRRLRDRPIAGIDDLHRLLTEEQAGVRRQTLTIIRDLKRETVEVTPTLRK